MSKMFVIAHKEFAFKLPDNYFVYYVGNISNSKELNDYPFRDNINLPNISEKNANYCELTALYSITTSNNICNENIGLSHYRRYFYNPFLSLFHTKFLSVKSMDKLLNKYDILIPFCDNLKMTVYDTYSKDHYEADLIAIRNIILEKFPDYIETFDDYFSHNKASYFNMFYSNIQIIKNYSEWLFDIFFSLEKVISIDDRTDYQKRLYGFLSEHLFNVWVLKNNLKIKYVFVRYTEMSLVKNNLISFKKIIQGKKVKF